MRLRWRLTRARSLAPDRKPGPNPTAGIPFAQQRLLHGGKQLADSRTLSALGLESGGGLHLVLSLRGGAPKKKGKGDKGKKGDKKGKGDGGKAPLGEGEEMTPEQLKEQVEQLRGELDKEREERNYFQVRSSRAQ